MSRTYLQIPTAIDLAAIAVGAHHAHHQLPPPGMALGIDPTAEWLNAADGVFALHLPVYLSGSPTSGAADDWWWSTVGDVLAAVLVPDSEEYSWLLQKIATLASRTLGETLVLPLLKKGTANTIMRWLSSTVRGTLAANETFQWKMDWGNPGDDPDIDEAAALAFAEVIANGLEPLIGVTGLYGMWSPSVKWTEVGVTTKTQTDATGSDGTGGNLEQSYPTQWWKWPTGEEPVGASATNSLPYEVACAVTLQTETRGPRGRGRFYLPPFGVGQMTANGLYTNATADNTAAQVAAMLNGIKDDSGYAPLVVSRRAIQLHEITSVLVGHVPDSQRRRRRSQIEARVQVVL